MLERILEAQRDVKEGCSQSEMNYFMLIDCGLTNSIELQHFAKSLESFSTPAIHLVVLGLYLIEQQKSFRYNRFYFSFPEIHSFY